jgi:hypothetical protein
MKRVALGVFILLHGLAHAAAGVWASSQGSQFLVTPLWGIAMLGYLATGLGLLRTPALRDHWKQLLVIATISSMMLLMMFAELVGLIGASVDVVLLLLAFEWAQGPSDDDIAAADAVGTAGLPHPLAHRVGWTVGTLFLAYAFLVVLIRPIYLQWGTTAEERVASLPGDELVPDARYRVDHAVTIRAPADSVWPWLVQLGQDRGGFYSYAWLERMIGDRVQNADRIHPEWQRLEVGDTIRAVQADYLGGRLRATGWRVGEVVPGRALYLENWGAFVLRPVDSTTTRFIIRTRGPERPSLPMVALAPLTVFVFEPAHFIMQRGMMHGIRRRAEHRARVRLAGP